MLEQFFAVTYSAYSFPFTRNLTIIINPAGLICIYYAIASRLKV